MLTVTLQPKCPVPVSLTRVLLHMSRWPTEATKEDATGLEQLGLPLDDVDPTVFQLCVDYCHHRKLSSKRLRMDQVPTLLAYADRFLLQGFAEEIIRQAVKCISRENVMQAIQIGNECRQDRIGAPGLWEHALTYAATHVDGLGTSWWAAESVGAPPVAAVVLQMWMH